MSSPHDRDPNEVVTCPDCYGKGTVADVNNRGNDGYPLRECPTCLGRGRLTRRELERLRSR
jgi:DnaJ-class molecular chaperone